jgi:predicted transcriptional regulator
MVIDLTPEQEARLLRQAQHSGRALSDLMCETASWLLQFEENDEAELQRGLDQADRGEFIEHEEMEARFGRMMQAKTHVEMTPEQASPLNESQSWRG